MKKIVITFFVAILMAIANCAQAQIIKEKTYQNVGGPAVFRIVHLEVSGDKYACFNTAYFGNPEVVLYNMDHSIWKTIDLIDFPECAVYLEYVSENLFSLDGKVDLLLVTYDISNVPSTWVINEDGDVRFLEEDFVPYHTDSPNIFGTSDGTKMILFSSDPSTQYEAVIYSLPGNLPTTISDSQWNASDQQKGSLHFSPNPTSSGIVRINYKLPDGINSGEIILYNLMGQQIKTYRVDQTFQDLEITTSDFPAGNYMWQLQAGNYQTTQKMVVIK